MNVLEFSGIIFAGSLLAGLLGALTGLGGGVVIIPLLVLLLKVDIHYAVGAALVSVIATSCGAAAAYLRDGFCNVRLGMFLEIATTLGALAGAALATHAPERTLAILFGAVLAVSAWSSWRSRPASSETAASDSLAARLRMNSCYPAPEGLRDYRVSHLPAGFAFMGLAGVISGLLGIGSGAFKVIALDRVMKLPFKVSTTTSNFMIGVTAAASAGVYLRRGYIDPGLVMPVMLGVLAGATLGARLLVQAPVAWLRKLFLAVLLLLAAQMIYHGITGRM